MPEVPKNPIKIFISYSWTNQDHQQWVIKLAEELQSHYEFDVTLDIWELRTGHDVTVFMERIANDNKLVDKVIIVLDKGYTEKANKRERGVGTEAQIISAEVYREINQAKFLPIVREKDEDGKPFVPVFLKNRKFIDFSNDNDFEDSFEELKRDLADLPKYIKPQKSRQLPAHFYDSTIVRYKTATLANGIEAILDKYPNKVDYKLQEFLDEVLGVLPELKINNFPAETSKLNLGKKVLDSIDKYTPLKDDFILFFDKVAQSGQEFNQLKIIAFFEKILDLFPINEYYTHPDELRKVENDIFKFIQYELFISLIAVLLKNERYNLIADLLHSTYQIRDFEDETRRRKVDYTYFNTIIHSVDEYYRQDETVEESSRKSVVYPMAFLIMDRKSQLTEDQLKQADLLCFFICELHQKGDIGRFRSTNWFPILYPFGSMRSFTLINYMESKNHFDKVKGVFAVEYPHELRKLILDYEERTHSHPGYSNDPGEMRRAPLFYDVVKPNSVGIVR